MKTEHIASHAMGLMMNSDGVSNVVAEFDDAVVGLTLKMSQQEQP